MKLFYKHIKSNTQTNKNLKATNFGFYNDKKQFRRIYLNISKKAFVYCENKEYKELNIPVINNEYLLFGNYDNLMYILYNV
jgi:hypothetical protein